MIHNNPEHRITKILRSDLNEKLFNAIRNINRLLHSISIITLPINVVLPINVFHKKFHNIRFIENFIIRNICNKRKYSIYGDILYEYKVLLYLLYSYITSYRTHSSLRKDNQIKNITNIVEQSYTFIIIEIPKNRESMLARFKLHGVNMKVPIYKKIINKMLKFFSKGCN